MRRPCAVLVLAVALGSVATIATASDLKNLPLGDGRVGTTPAVGWVDSCVTRFHGGVNRPTPWIHSDGTFDVTAKPKVQGSVTWALASVSFVITGATRQVTSNDLPPHPSGIFPISQTDPASTYDPNPNAIGAQPISLALPAMPQAAATPQCLGQGPIGIMTTGVVLYSALDGQGRDGVAHEIQDACDGHPDRASRYHYHNLSGCIADTGSGHSALLGYAYDGFGIYGVRGENGKELTNADLDACHGHTHAIVWDGQTVRMYHYHMTRAYPYTLGCYHGTPIPQRRAGPNPRFRNSFE